MAGRFHRMTEDIPTQYLCLHPLGPWAEFLRAWTESQLTLIAVKVDPGQPKDLPPLRLDEIENKYRFIRYLEMTERKGILNPGFDSKLKSH